MSNPSTTQTVPSRRTGALTSRATPMTSAGIAAMQAQQNGKTPAAPWKMPDVEIGEIVLYQPTSYVPGKASSPAVVISIGNPTIELAVFSAEVGLRLLPDGVRHKDDPEFERLRRVNQNAEERSEMGVWFRAPGQFTPGERKRIKLLLDLYGSELDEFETSGTIHGKPIGGVPEKPPA